ncbi:unnamed protein product [Adineta steineri]|uniref:Serine aminopeptidase S33 domain-containing protein n=1 Tax=Adineta steineri TaxID=433720 RepID=A0A815DTF1_9BILA|nr:unnamed protein product [Adineta steineri]CAF3703860.1 unnamed protein product [Adineta steineri]
MTSTSPDVTFDYRSDDGTSIVVYRWNTNERPRAAMQLTHGMGEHGLRYGEFARALNTKGIVVYAQDQRGHGATAKATNKFGSLGHDGWQMLINDIHLLVKHIRTEHSNTPLILLGHSMGSFAVQQYLIEHSNDIDATILTGTVALDLIAPAFNLDQPFDLSSLNTPFQPARTDFDWLSRDETIVDAYVKDSLCGFGLDTESVKGMISGGQRMVDTQLLQQIRHDLPIYISVGESDPIHQQLAGVKILVDRFQTAGLTDITLRTYPEARHEVLNETNRNEIVNDILNWIDNKVLTLPITSKKS